MKRNFIEEIIPVQNLLDELLSQEEMRVLQGGHEEQKVSCDGGDSCHKGTIENAGMAAW